ncbi:hypothetical protein SAMN04487945_2155 [Halobacterium jilantaiense]|uniref:Uncharacterized protein n=1 Tax=Halobacterium jilantaiense TaxID=355548 RepID=A0A1I0Q1L4_9EURY|nr:hypothetical protein SAMN04487945_2155 [Halobacterium jilantaiense]
MIDAVEEHREDLADLTDTDLPAAGLAEALLELSEQEAEA